MSFLEDANAERDEVVCIGLTMLNGSVAEAPVRGKGAPGQGAGLFVEGFLHESSMKSYRLVEVVKGI